MQHAMREANYSVIRTDLEFIVILELDSCPESNDAIKGVDGKHTALVAVHESVLQGSRVVEVRVRRREVSHHHAPEGGGRGGC